MVWDIALTVHQQAKKDKFSKKTYIFLTAVELNWKTIGYLQRTRCRTPLGCLCISRVDQASSFYTTHDFLE